MGAQTRSQTRLKASTALDCFSKTLEVQFHCPSGQKLSNAEMLNILKGIVSDKQPPRTLPNPSVTPAVPDDLATCKLVLVQVGRSGCAPLAPLYTGPFLVLERYQSSFKLQLGTRQEIFNISRLKPAYTPLITSPAQPLKRGGPRKLPPVQRNRSSFFNHRDQWNSSSFFSSTSETTNEIQQDFCHLPFSICLGGEALWTATYRSLPDSN